tara:strand:- start:23200 stop:24972 length:1773 start_codon:yes stop_codon:yes gene_type:complete
MLLNNLEKINLLKTTFKKKIKKVVFVCPPDVDKLQFSYDVAKRKRYLNYPPYGLGLLAEKIKLKNVKSQIINLQNDVLREAILSENEEKFDYDSVWKKSLENLEADIFALTCMFSQTHISFQSVSNHLKQQYPNVPQVAGGVHVTNAIVETNTREKFYNDLKDVNLFFLYEGDLAFLSFVETINENKNQLFQVANREIGIIPEKAVPSKEDICVIPSWELMPPNETSKWGKVGAFYFLKKEKPVTATVLANRGCRAQCTFCSVRNFNGVGVRRRSVDSVIDELSMLKNDFGVNHIMWLDDDFLYDKKEAYNLFNKMIQKNINITWDCSNGVIAASCTEELMDAAEKSGCLGLILGMESGNRKILKSIKKPGTVETFLKAAEVLKKYEKIHSRVFLMIGFPNETFAQIQDTLNVALEMNLDWYNIAPLQPLPNTPIYESMLAQNLIDENKNFTDLKFNSGPTSRAADKKNKGRDLLSSDFKDIFLGKLSDIPDLKEIDLVWAYLNFHLNFKRLFDENREIKLDLNRKYLDHISDKIAPDNAIAIFFSCYLDKKIEQKININKIQTLEDILNKSPYWMKRFDDFKLDVESLK